MLEPRGQRRIRGHEWHPADATYRDFSTLPYDKHMNEERCSGKHNGLKHVHPEVRELKYAELSR